MLRLSLTNSMTFLPQINTEALSIISDIDKGVLQFELDFVYNRLCNVIKTQTRKFFLGYEFKDN